MYALQKDFLILQRILKYPPQDFIEILKGSLAMPWTTLQCLACLEMSCDALQMFSFDWKRL